MAPTSKPLRTSVDSPSSQAPHSRRATSTVTFRKFSPFRLLFLATLVFFITVPETCFAHAQAVTTTTPTATLFVRDPASFSTPTLIARRPETTATPDVSTSAPTSVDTSTAYSYMTSSPPIPTLKSDNGLGDGGLGISTGNADAAGASGTTSGNMSISTGGIIGLSVGVVIVAIGGIFCWYLWYMTQKRQLTVRQSLRRLTNPVRMSSRPRTGTATGPAFRSDGRPSTRNAVKLTSPLPSAQKGAPGSQIPYKYRQESSPESGSSFRVDLEKSAKI